MTTAPAHPVQYLNASGYPPKFGSDYAASLGEDHPRSDVLAVCQDHRKVCRVRREPGISNGQVQKSEGGKDRVVVNPPRMDQGARKAR